jgi:hypothetical protein
VVHSEQNDGRLTNRIKRADATQMTVLIWKKVTHSERTDWLRLDRSTALYIYKAKNGKLLVLFTDAQKTKFIFKQYIKTFLAKIYF